MQLSHRVKRSSFGRVLAFFKADQSLILFSVFFAERTSDEEMPKCWNTGEKVSQASVFLRLVNLCQSGIGIPASGSVRFAGHGLVRRCPAWGQRRILRVDELKKMGALCARACSAAETHQFLYIYYFLMWKPLSSPCPMWGLFLACHSARELPGYLHTECAS